MPDKEIKIIRNKADDTVGPEESAVPRLRNGATIKFTTEDGAQGVSITFDEDSPFDTKAVPYKTSLKITAKFNESNPRKNLYRYTCELKVGGKTLRTPGGGEMEVVKG